MKILIFFNLRLSMFFMFLCLFKTIVKFYVSLNDSMIVLKKHKNIKNIELMGIIKKLNYHTII